LLKGDEIEADVIAGYPGGVRFCDLMEDEVAQTVDGGSNGHVVGSLDIPSNEPSKRGLKIQEMKDARCVI
jgi:hypothetical protein